MNAERTEYRQTKRQEPLGILPAITIGIHNLAAKERIGESRTVGFIKERMLKVTDLLFLAMGDKDSDRLIELSSGTSEYNPVKDFGCIRVEEASAEFDYVDPKTNFVLKKGQSHLRIHLYPEFSSEQSPPKRIKEAEIRIREAMGKVAEYIKSNKQRLPEHCLVGITYAELAEASRRFGFTVPKTSLPERIKRIFAKVSKGHPGVSLCFQTYDEIINRFSGSNQSEKTA